ncbi:MAG TPA: hypothetical protein VIJ51_17850 [Solirubrobacteraceae bacterium]
MSGDDPGAVRPPRDSISGAFDRRLSDALALVEAEYLATTAYVERISRTIQNGRTFGLTAVGGVVTLAIQQEAATIALLAVPLTFMFALVDGYQSFQYQNAAARLRAIELIRQSRISMTLRGDRPPEQSERRLRSRINQLNAGPYQEELRGFGREELSYLPRPIFRHLYPAVATGAAVVACAVQLAHGFDARFLRVLVAAFVLGLAVLRQLRVIPSVSTIRGGVVSAATSRRDTRDS